MISAPGAVLAYHRVCDIDRDPFGLAVGPDRLAAQLSALSEVADLVPLSSIVPARRSRRSPNSRRPRVALTFDDGYLDNAHVLPEVLAQSGAPATVFLTTSVLEGGEEFWWDRLEHVLLDGEPQVQMLDVTIEARRLRADVRNPQGRQRALKALNRRLRALAPEAIDEAITELSQQTGLIPRSCVAHARMTREDVVGLAANPLIEIGAHTTSHPVLSTLPSGDQRAEIEQSWTTLTEVTGRAPVSFAYPFGFTGSWDSSTEAIVRDCGFERACTTVPGAIDGRVHRFAIPRIGIGDWSPDEVVDLVERWLEA
jgi:peptidoglycan/xylan/chitin deacetylase (PgdA/CDA1 family)